jgi:hypothetical protein
MPFFQKRAPIIVNIFKHTQKIVAMYYIFIAITIVYLHRSVLWVLFDYH